MKKKISFLWVIPFFICWTVSKAFLYQIRDSGRLLQYTEEKMFQTPVRFQSKSQLLNGRLKKDMRKFLVDKKAGNSERSIIFSPKALRRLQQMKNEKGVSKDMFVRIGVKSGGCSGLSYSMDLVEKSDVQERDHIEKYGEEGISCIMDPKSLIYVAGTEIDFSDDLMGGGFRIKNPNASRTCGCGMSFQVPKEKSGKMLIPNKPSSCSSKNE